MIGSGGFKTISRLNNTQALDKPAQGCQEIESACSCSVSPEWKVVYEGDAGKQGRPRTSADPRGATETRGWLRRDIVHVHAAGVTPTELLWYPTTHTKSGTARMRAVPGHEFSGVIAAIGKDVQDFKVGDEVYGMNDWFADGATAEFCITLPQNIARKPATLSHEAAASVPIGALTSWQGLIDRAKLEPGERILVHGGAGAVGLYAVQLAHICGARLITTVSTQDIDFVKRLGANEAIDYRACRFGKEVQDVDVVFDAVGSDTLERSWGVLKPSGRMITIAADSEGTADERVKDAFFIVEPNQEQLVEIVEIAKQLDAGHLRAFVKTTVPLNEASAAYSGAVRDKGGYGKIVITVPA